MSYRVGALCLMAAGLGGCVTTGGGSVAGGECKFLERPQYAVLGKGQYDQDWIDSTIEGGVGACKWERPAPRPVAMDAPPAPAPVKHVAAKPVKKHPKWLHLLRSWPHKAKPIVATPEKPAPVTVVPTVVEPFAIPAPPAPVDDLLNPAE